MDREPAPPYPGEGDFALWHFSEDPSIESFTPRVPALEPGGRALVWAVDTRHAPLYWFPRDCPRGCIWPAASTSDADREKFFGQSAASRVHVIEASWLSAVRSCQLHAYQLPAGSFRPHDVGGYWVSEEPVGPLSRMLAGDLLERHAGAGIELRVTPSIWPFWDQVIHSTVGFSGCRLRNASPRERISPG